MLLNWIWVQGLPSAQYFSLLQQLWQHQWLLLIHYHCLYWHYPYAHNILIQYRNNYIGEKKYSLVWLSRECVFILVKRAWIHIPVCANTDFPDVVFSGPALGSWSTSPEDPEKTQSQVMWFFSSQCLVSPPGGLWMHWTATTSTTVGIIPSKRFTDVTICLLRKRHVVS